jgi:archaellum component FlaC
MEILMFKKVKLLLFIARLYDSLMKVKFIKALMTLISVLMSYKIIKFLWYFNKAFIYILGLIFVGFNWSDYRILIEIKLIYDSIILWFMNFFPKNPIAYDLKVKTEKDLKEILIQDKIKSKKEGLVTDYRPYHISDNLESVRKTRKDINHTYISDGTNDWSFSELIRDPYLIGCVAILIIASGTIIVYKYDIDIADWTQWSWTHIKSGFFATTAFIWKIIQWLNGRGGGGNPPAIGDRIPRRGPFRNVPEINEPGPSNKTLIKYGESYIEKFNNGLNRDAEEFNRIYNDISPDIDSLTLEITRIKDLPVSKENYINLADNYKRLFTLYSKLPMQEGFMNPMKGKDVMLVADSSGSLTPKASTSFNIDEIPLIDGFSIPKEPIIPYVNSPLPMSNIEMYVSPALEVNNMTSYHGLTINELNETFDKFLRYELTTLDQFKTYLSLRGKCFDIENENFREAYKNKTDEIKLLQQEIARLYELPVDKSAIKDCLMRFEVIYSQIPHKTHLSLIDAVDTYNMNTYPEKFNDPNQDVYDISAMERYADQLDNNLDDNIDIFAQVKGIYGEDLADIYNEIERLKLLPNNSTTNKALYEMHLKLFDLLYKYPVIDPIDLIHKSPFIQPKNSELLSIENIPEL